MKNIFVLFFCLCFAGITLAQNTQLKGKVLDAATNAPLAGANVQVTGGGGAITDQNGNFALPCNGALELSVSFIGYETERRQVKDCGEAVNFSLALSSSNLNTVEITATSSLNKSVLYQPFSIAKLGETEIKRSTGLLLDDAVNVNIPGVFMERRTFSAGQQFNIRGYGNGARGTNGVNSNFDGQGSKVYLNGIPLTDAEGITLMDDIDFGSISNVEVVKGPAGSLYGLAIAGVVNLNTIKPTPGQSSFGQDLLVGSYGLRRYTTHLQIAKERAAEKNAGEVVENRARQRLSMNSPAQLRAMQGDVSGRVAALNDVRAAHVGDAATTAKLNVALDDAIRELTILDTALKMIGDDAKATAVEAFGPLQDKLKGLQGELAAVEGQHPDVATLQKRLDSTAFDVGAAFASASTTEQAREQSAALMKAMTPLGTEVAAVVERATKLQAEKKEFAESVTRGQAIGMTPAQKAAKEATDMATDIANAASEMTDSVARQAFVGGFVESKREELQAALKGYSDERLNALAGGPSRAALDATDVTTAGGSTELNRLLRGDDASKDVNLAEMKHQSELLERVIDAVKAATGFIAS